MSTIIILSDDQSLLNLLENIANGILDTKVLKANMDSEVGDIIQNASANSILIIAVTQASSKTLIEQFKDSVFGIPSIFISTYNANDAYKIAQELNANSLFLGGSNDLGIKYAIERLSSHHAQDSWKIVDGKKVVFINKFDIGWIKIQGNYSSIYHKGKTTIVRKPLKQIEEELTSINLTKIHRSVLINSDYISEIRISDNEIAMQDGEILPIGRSFKKSLSTLIS